MPKYLYEDAFLTGILENTFDGFWDWHIQEDYEYMSPRFWEMLGFDPKEKRHHPEEWQKHIFEEDIGFTMENFNKHIATKGKHPFSQEVRYKHKDGSTVWIICRGNVIEWSDTGEPLRIVGTHTDITELKQAQEALVAKAKLAALGEMAAGISHEINNPLAIMSAIVDWIDSKSKKEPSAMEGLSKKTEILKKTILRVTGIIDDLRTYASSTESGPKNAVLLKDIVGLSASLYAERLKRHGIELREDYDPELKITCHPSQMSQVFLSLMSNAKDAIVSGDEGERWIGVSAMKVDEKVKVYFRDSGPGVSNTIKAKLFEPFVTTKSQGKGSGLGLSTSRRLVASNGGELNYLDDEMATTFLLEFSEAKA